LASFCTSIGLLHWLLPLSYRKLLRHITGRILLQLTDIVDEIIATYSTEDSAFD